MAFWIQVNCVTHWPRAMGLVLLSVKAHKMSAVRWNLLATRICVRLHVHSSLRLVALATDVAHLGATRPMMQSARIRVETILLKATKSVTAIAQLHATHPIPARLEL